MRLSAWLREHDRSLEWLAKEVNRDSSLLSKVARGLARPSNEVAAAIHRLTDGAVTSVDHEEAYLDRNPPPDDEAAPADPPRDPDLPPSGAAERALDGAAT